MTFKRPCDRICHGVICVFNEEIKERYLQETNANKDTRRLLKNVQQAEKIIGKELCEMDRNEAIKAVELVGTYDLQTINIIISCWKLYSKWCYENNFFSDGKFGIWGISATNIDVQEAIRGNLFPNEKELVKALKSVALIYDGYIEIVACVFAWLGIQSPLDIKESDVDLFNRKISCNGEIIVDGFSDFVCDFLKSYRNLRESTRENGAAVYKVIKDNSYDTFIKQFCSPNSKKLGKPVEMRVIRTAINKLNRKYESAGNPPRITYVNVLKSGSLNRLYNAEINGLKVFDKDNEGIVKSYFYRSNYRSIIWLYRHYKQAFNL